MNAKKSCMKKVGTSRLDKGSGVRIGEDSNTITKVMSTRDGSAITKVVTSRQQRLMGKLEEFLVLRDTLSEN